MTFLYCKKSLEGIQKMQSDSRGLGWQRPEAQHLWEAPSWDHTLRRKTVAHLICTPVLSGEYYGLPFISRKIQQAKELEIYKPSGRLICFSTHHSDIIKYWLWQDGRGWQRLLDSLMAVPSYIVQQQQSCRQCPHQQGRTHPSSCLLQFTRLEWCTTYWPTLACW